MSLTICFVVYNEEKNLSLIQQNLHLLHSHGSAHHRLILDNGSTDGSSHELKVLAEKTNSTYVFRQRNHLPEARQMALSGCSTDWIAFVDADCSLPADWLDVVFQNINSASPWVAALGGPWRMGGPWAKTYSHFFSTFLGHFGMPYLRSPSPKTSLVDHLPTANIVYRRTAALDVGGFSSWHPTVGEDLDLSSRLRKNQYQLLFLPNMGIKHWFAPSRRAWSVKMFFYGLARGMWCVEHPQLISAKTLLPFLFVGLLVAALWTNFSVLWSAVGLYLFSCFMVSLWTCHGKNHFRLFSMLILTHVFYSLGQFCGVFLPIYARWFLKPKFDQPSRKEPPKEAAATIDLAETANV